MVYIKAAKRTPLGKFQGLLSGLSAPQLGGIAIGAVKPLNTTIDEIYMGCVLQAGVGQAPACQAAIIGGVDDTVPTTTINKVCGSGLKAIMIGADQIRLGDASNIIAGGMESMSNVPYGLTRTNLRFGHQEFTDLLLKDGLEDAYNFDENNSSLVMGTLADRVAQKYNFTRAAQEEYALDSYNKCLTAQKNGELISQIVAIEVKQKGKVVTVASDETVTTIIPEKFANLKPAFMKGGSITAATSSLLADGAAAVWLSNDANGALAKIEGYASAATNPQNFTTAPVLAINKLLKEIGWSVSDVDVFEINEAFAMVPMVAAHDLKIPFEKINMYGGACNLGHPLGASGARVLVNLVHLMIQKKLKKGVAALCIGGGEGVAMAITIM